MEKGKLDVSQMATVHPTVLQSRAVESTWDETFKGCWISAGLIGLFRSARRDVCLRESCWIHSQAADVLISNLVHPGPSQRKSSHLQLSLLSPNQTPQQVSLQSCKLSFSRLLISFCHTLPLTIVSTCSTHPALSCALSVALDGWCQILKLFYFHYVNSMRLLLSVCHPLSAQITMFSVNTRAHGDSHLASSLSLSTVNSNNNYCYYHYQQ